MHEHESSGAVPSGFFALRTPLLSFDVLVEWGEGLEASRAEAGWEMVMVMASTIARATTLESMTRTWGGGAVPCVGWCRLWCDSAQQDTLMNADPLIGLRETRASLALCPEQSSDACSDTLGEVFSW